MAEQDTSEGLKALLSNSRSAGQTFFPKALRDRVARHAERQRHQGVPIKATARELGLSHHTLQYWRSEKAKAKPKPEGKVKRVRVVRDQKPTTERSRLTIHGPAGTTVEGLSVEDVVEILRRLG